MIQKFFVYSSTYDRIFLLYDTQTFEIDFHLLLNLIKATIQLGSELQQDPYTSLQELEIGAFQITLRMQDELTYILIQDSLDNESFTDKILGYIVDDYHDDLYALFTDFDEVKLIGLCSEISKSVVTMKFPIDLLEEVENVVRSQESQLRKYLDILLLTDLDDGPVKSWFIETELSKSLAKVLMEILSELEIEKSWVGDIPVIRSYFDTSIPKNEIWFIIRIGVTDFCLLGRGYYSSINQRDTIIKMIQTMSQFILELLKHAGKKQQFFFGE